MSIPLTSRERLALGQAQRKHMRRADLAVWQPKLRRADPLALLANSMRGRVPELVPIKYDRMAASPFGFFRGAVPVMAYDLSLGPNTGILTQLCGDAHVRNLGAFAAPDGRLVFDINDFDETIRGPFEWDVQAPRRKLHPRRTRGRREEQPLPRRHTRLPRTLSHVNAHLRAHARA